MKRLSGFLKQQKGLIALMVGAAIGASLLEGLTLSLIYPLFESVKGQANASAPFPLSVVSGFFVTQDILIRFRWVAIAMVITTLLKGLLTYVSNVGTFQLQTKVIKYYRVLSFEQLMNVGIGFINQGRQSHFQAIAVTMTEQIGSMVSILGLLIPKLFTMVVLLTLLIMLSWKMTLISILMVLAASLLLYRLVHSSEQIGRKHTENIKNLNNVVLDTLLGMKVIRLFNREKHLMNRFDQDVNEYNNNLLALAKVRSSMQPIFETIGILCLSSILIVGSLIFTNNQTASMEVILTFCLIFFRMLQPALAINQARVDLKSLLPSFEEVNKFLESQGKLYLSNGSRDIQKFNNTIEWRNVSFRYNSQQAFVLNNISFSIARGTKVGVVGSSGSGKSTLGELLLRFYDPQEGDIFIDGKDLKQYDQYSWRRIIGVVSQDIFLFHDTIAANIAFANPNVDENRIIEASKRAHAHEFIQNLPQGYQTLIGDRGVLLSGGQRQRIAIARAILNDPQILLFDEATSALDTESEKIVQLALDEVGRNKTVITIAHRLSTVVDSDQIIVMEAGKVVQRGKHQQLLNQEGLYRQLVQMQNIEQLPIGSNNG